MLSPCGPLAANLRDSDHGLSARQTSILPTVYTAPTPRTVRDLLEALAIFRPAVSWALDRLCGLGYARRRRDECDRRSMHIAPTELGAAFLDAFADRISRVGRTLTSRTPFEAGTPQSVRGRRLDIEGAAMGAFVYSCSGEEPRRIAGRTVRRGGMTFRRTPGRSPTRRATRSLFTLFCAAPAAVRAPPRPCRRRGAGSACRLRDERKMLRL